MQWADRIGHRVKLRDLHILLAVVELGSMAKAASRLAISHPVISKTISDLEQTLGVQLLDRNARGVEPTVYGRALLKCGVAVFDEMRQGLTGLEVLANPNSGDLRIGCPEMMTAGLLPVIAERFRRQRSGVRLHVAFANTLASQFDELRDRNVDLLIGTIPNPFLEEELVAENLYDERTVPVAGLHSRWVRRRHIELSELVDEPWFLPPRDSVPWRITAEIFSASGLDVPRHGIVSLSPFGYCAGGDRRVHLAVPGVRSPIQSRTIGAEDIAGEVAEVSARHRRNRYSEEPDDQPISAVIH